MWFQRSEPVCAETKVISASESERLFALHQAHYPVNGTGMVLCLQVNRTLHYFHCGERLDPSACSHNDVPLRSDGSSPRTWMGFSNHRSFGSEPRFRV